MGNIFNTEKSIEISSDDKPQEIELDEINSENSNVTIQIYPSLLKVLEFFSEMDYRYRHYEISATQ